MGSHRDIFYIVPREICCSSFNLCHRGTEAGAINTRDGERRANFYFINGLINSTDMQFVKSLLTSLFQREEHPSIAMTLTPAPLPLREREKGRGGLVIEGPGEIL